MKKVRLFTIIITVFWIILYLFNANKHSNKYLANKSLYASLKNGTLLLSGLRIIKQRRPELPVSAIHEISKINERITDLDIALIPLLEDIPELFVSDKDWGIYRLSSSGIEYRSGESGASNFIPFKKDIRPLIVGLFEECDQNPPLLRNTRLTKETMVLNFEKVNDINNIAAILRRGRNQLLAIYRDEKAIVRMLPDAKINLPSLYLMSGLIEEVPRVLKSKMKRSDWYWVPENGGITFVHKRKNERQFVRFTDDPVIAELPETKYILKRLQHYKNVLRGNHLLNKLDQLILSNKKKLYTKYDELRMLISRRGHHRCPISFSYYASYDQVAIREKIPIEQIATARFSLRELRLLNQAVHLSPNGTKTVPLKEYFSYRPKVPMSFTYAYDRHQLIFFLSPLQRIDVEDAKRLFLSKDLKAYLNRFPDDYVAELKFINNVLHEQAHHAYDDLTLEQKKSYSAISWEPDSWKNLKASQKKAVAVETPESHFIVVYPDWPPFQGHDSSVEDFANHLAAYRMFGSFYKKESRRKPALAAKYRFIKDNVYGGDVFDQNYEILLIP